MVGTMAKIDDSVKKKVPELRFKGFTDEWEERKLSDIVSRLSKSSNNSELPRVEFEDIVSGEGRLNKDVSHKLDDRKGILFSSQNILYGKLRPYLKNWLLADFKGIALGDFWVFKSINSDPKFVYSLIQSNHYQKVANDTSGTKMPRSDWKKVSSTEFQIPSSLEEQKKIGSFFKKLDDTIALHQRKLDLLKETKKGFLQKMFPKNGEKVPEIRFPGFTEDWEERKFKDILKTHSFRSYLAGVSEDGEYEVIQQGDKPIVGYSDGEPFTDYKDITLFGDHTVSLYKPKSPFFVATDGVKILSADNFEGDYLYTTLERYKPEPQGYKRHFTILKNQDVWFTENMEEQQKIGVFFKQLDDTITLHQRKLDLLKEQKKGFLQKMFV
ncbi:restriction endonuclease subunit S [Enterococcus faecalis]|nr:restriction endonuclease subunit S [Enterococcus faecalis]